MDGEGDYWRGEIYEGEGDVQCDAGELFVYATGEEGSVADIVLQSNLGKAELQEALSVTQSTRPKWLARWQQETSWKDPLIGTMPS